MLSHFTESLERGQSRIFDNAFLAATTNSSTTYDYAMAGLETANLVATTLGFENSNLII
jgi:hypothetical protein